MFTVSGSNKGMLVGPEFYMQDNSKDKRDIGMGMINNMTQDLGVQIGDMVNMMVTSKMGVRIEEKQSEITNKNVQMGALNAFTSTINTFNNNTVKSLNNANALTSYVINNSDSSSVSAKVGSEGLSSDVDFNLKVDQLAQSHSVMIGGYASASEKLPAGDIVINFGEYTGTGFQPNADSGQVSISVTDGMSLAEVAEKISDSSPDIKAEVVEDGKGGYGIAVVSSKTGEDQAMQISGTGALNDFAYDGKDTAKSSELQKAQDAKYTINGVPMSNPTNNIKYDGVDMTLSKATGEVIKISSEANPDGVVENVKAFVTNYNALVDMYNMFNESTPYYDFVGSLHDTDISDKIQKEIDKMWSMVKSSGINMSELGISMQPDGTMKLDELSLRKSLDKNPNIAKELLASTSKTSSEWMSITSNGSAIDGEHEIVIDEAPTKANLTTAPIANPTTLTADTDIELNVNGQDVTVNLPAGDYTPNQIASKISASVASSGVDGYSVTANAKGELVFESSEYGTSQFVEIKNDVPELGLTAEKASGGDVKGYINGQRVIGKGTTLESKFDPSTEGLVVVVDPDTMVLGQKVAVTTQTGVLDRMATTMDGLTDPISGVITEEVKTIEDMLKEGSKESLVDELSDLEKEKEKWYTYYTTLYSNLSAQLADLDNTAQYLDSMFNSDKD